MTVAGFTASAAFTNYIYLVCNRKSSRIARVSTTSAPDLIITIQDNPAFDRAGGMCSDGDKIKSQEPRQRLARHNSRDADI